MDPIHVAIVHYHVRSGGVTRVIQNAVQSLEGKDVQFAVLAGEWPGDQRPWPIFRAVPGLAYGVGSSGEALADQLVEAAKDVFGREPDIWHIHNHSLGKNLSLPLAVHALARRGCKLLLQPHDFAEDGRPSNFGGLLQGLADEDMGKLGSILYPLCDHVHYAVLNGRDESFLKIAGLPEHQLHVLHNGVWIGDGGDEEREGVRSGPARSYLYPSRSIRRKNLGEFLFWSAIAEKGVSFATTLAPDNPQERGRYDQWVRFSEDEKLPVTFEVGANSDLSFKGLLQSYDAMVSTSIAEGFGLAFLEPWLASRPLVGRDLGDITSDFKLLGVNLEGLYSELWVPAAWVGIDDLRGKLKVALEASYASYDQSMPGDALDRSLAAATQADSVSFAKLDEELQMRVIRHVRADPEASRQVSPPWLVSDTDWGERIKNNRKLVESVFNLEKYGYTLSEIYQKLMNTTPSPLSSLSAQRLLESFMSPERFFLLRT